MDTRKPVFAGSWYPAAAAECENLIKEFQNDSRFHVDPDPAYKGGIVPHAGWVFSGSLACNVIAAMQPQKPGEGPDTVVIFGMHLPPNTPGTIMAEGTWDTPFGEIEIDADLAEGLCRDYKFTVETPTRFTPDNTIELQLPFIRYFFPNARLLPVGPPAKTAAADIGRRAVEIAEAAGRTITVIGSTDLTHYGPSFGFTPAGKGSGAYEWVKNKNDRRVIDAMLAMDPESVVNEALTNHNACCPGAAAASLAAAQQLGARNGQFVGYSSSYEHNPGDTFVGYGGVLFY
ncbi:MAG TPA: AmmeMemoRadiSam system protein B [Desulfosalsimonadaceae bacterium]|nr:AmmeMemoRadiSam system protein B [Desulfosalsimonadaceae bacterium]